MKFTALKQAYYTVDCYEPEFDSDGRIVREAFVGTRTVSIDTGESASLNLDTETPMGVGIIIRNIKDRFGGLVYPLAANSTGASYTVWFEQPVLSPFGTREGFTSKARRLAAE